MESKIDNFLNELNEEQRKAVEATEGPVMIIAGAGSGKTRVLTYRIAHLLKKGVDPFRVLSLTFTNKAAAEMKERIIELIGGDARNLWMGTFHSVFARLLRREADKIGYPQNFTIYDTDDSKSLIKSITKELGLSDSTYKASTILGRISSMKNMLISAEAYANDAQYQSDDRAARREHFTHIFQTYNKRLFKSGAMDFDDLLYQTNMLLRDHPETLLKYQNMFLYILVDEYQDTNFSQYMILRQLAARHQNIAVVGDDAQSIYAFRGANIQNILNFQKHYPDTQVFKLEQNYRSTKTLVHAANLVISKNKDQLQKTVWTSNGEGEKIQLMRAERDTDEGRVIAQSIFNFKATTQAANSEFAILYRTNAQSRSIEEALIKLNIPYRIYGGLSFYQRKEIKDLLAYFRLTINPHDEEALRRVINYPKREIGDTTFDKMIVAAADNDISIWMVLDNIKDFNLGLSPRVTERITEFVNMIKSFTAMASTSTAYQMGDYIYYTTGLKRELEQDRTPEGVNRIENILGLFNGLKDFSEKPLDDGITPSLSMFMEDVALLTNEDRTKEDKSKSDKVLLMTIHSAKGLEFNYVYIAGMEENLFPSQMVLNSREELEEERRLFYVAVTRAKKQLILTNAMYRFRYGSPQSNEPSRFLEEIPAECLTNISSYREEASEHVYSRTPSAFRKPGPTIAQPPPSIVGKKLMSMNKAAQTTLPMDNAHLSGLKVGARVEHERFGQGEVLTVEGSYPNSKATVIFGNGEKKQLLLKFAKLKIVG